MDEDEWEGNEVHKGAVQLLDWITDGPQVRYSHQVSESLTHPEWHEVLAQACPEDGSQTFSLLYPSLFIYILCVTVCTEHFFNTLQEEKYQLTGGRISN